MKVTGIRTVRVPEHPQMLWLEVLTDEEITGLGETCLGPATVEAYLHETVAPGLLRAQAAGRQDTQGGAQVPQAPPVRPGLPPARP
jgi:L-alanine-DL-glutamate epimerase-like enolase superfamily enzyme